MYVCVLLTICVYIYLNIYLIYFIYHIYIYIHYIYTHYTHTHTRTCMRSPGGSDSKESICNSGDLSLIQVGKIPWRRKWQPTPVFLPGESHGQRSLVCYSPWGRKESDMTEWLILTLYMHTCTHTHTHIHLVCFSGEPCLMHFPRLLLCVFLVYRLPLCPSPLLCPSFKASWFSVMLSLIYLSLTGLRFPWPPWPSGRNPSLPRLAQGVSSRHLQSPLLDSPPSFVAAT